MLYTLDEWKLREIIRTVVNSCGLLETASGDRVEEITKKVLDEHRCLITEMAFKRKDYKEKIDNLSPQVIENICLIRHCAIYNNSNNRKHWGDELKGHLLTMARYNLKNSDRWEDKEEAIREVWNENDYFEPRTIEYVIHNKFRKEGFDTDTPEFLSVIEDAFNTFNTVIHLVSLGNIEGIYNFVDSL